jgi:ABC-2 type transport system ATP-binding protein
MSVSSGGASLGVPSARTARSAVDIREVTKRFGSVLAVDRLTFQVQEGTVTGFLGPNGAGKTTTLRILLGLVRPDGGTATVGGRAYRELENPTRLVGAVLEASSIASGRTARNHLRVRGLAGNVHPGRIDEVLQMVELTGAADRRVGSFSLGMRQRLSLAATLLGDPAILILDEPANGLDPEGVRWLRGFLKDLARDGKTVLVSSHLLSEVAQVADRVVIVNRGRLVVESSLDELLRDAGTDDLEGVFLSHIDRSNTTEAQR